VVCSDVLPAGQEVAEYMCYAGLKIEKVIDDDDKFVVIGMCAME